MSLRKILTAGLACAGMLVLILDGETALHSASAGIELCLRTVVPSLFPFLFLCSILTGNLWGSSFPGMKFLGKRLGIPEGAESLLITAILGGYPAGAQAIGECYRQGRLSKSDAQHLLTFCSNAGPAFLFGMVVLQFPDVKTIWALWTIQILSALLTGTLDRRESYDKGILSPKTTSVSQILTQTVKTMGIICGWILLFRIISGFLNRWFLWYFSEYIQVILTGLLELSNGCCALGEIQSVPLRFVVCSAFLSFGGLCVTMQTASVIGGLSLNPYLRGKLLQTAVSLVLAMLYLSWGWPLLAGTGAVLVLFPVRMKKRGGFPVSSGV